MQSRISKISTRCQNWGVHSTTCDPELRNESCALISFMGFPAILSALQPFQICISNRKKYSKLTFSNGSQMMGKKFMVNLHISLESTCKSRISKISTRCQNWEVHSTTCDPELRYESCALISFMGFPAILSALQPFQICISNRKNTNLSFSNDSQLMGKRFMANLHASLESTCIKKRISKISTRCQNLGSTPQLVILNSEMKVVHWHLLWGFLQY